MVEFLLAVVTNVVPFLIVLTVLVFVHEMGHYLVARWNGVRVEVFSVGFGPELFGWLDSKGTRWKFSAIPFGGYVKFFGDQDPSSAGDSEALSGMSGADRAVSFHHKSLAQRAAIVFAGPAANFIYAIVVLAGLFVLFGQRVTPPEIGRVLPDSAGATAGFEVGDLVVEVDGSRIRRFEQFQQFVVLNPGRELAVGIRRGDETLTIQATPDAVLRDDIEGIAKHYGSLGVLPANPAMVGRVYPDSPAAQAGFQAGDRIVAIDGKAVDNFEQLQDIVSASEGRQLRVTVLRDGSEVELFVAPRRDVRTEDTGAVTERWLIGIQRAARKPVQLGSGEALLAAVETSYDMIVRTMEYVGQMIAGTRGTEDLGGPLRIAHASGQAAQVGVEQLVLLSVLLSLNLGLINLFPIPILDGGHLMLYAIEAVRGRPLTARMQDFAFRLGLAVVLCLTVFATWNDLVNLRVVEFFAGIFS